ncbi:MAG: PAS domain-containing protein [Candidatus Acidiferrales bacterium]|jgi:two-component system cell cycle sensor histidine kinase/response regulator CckA
MISPKTSYRRNAHSLKAGLRRVERKQWWLSFSGVLVTLLLTVGIVSLSLTIYILQRPLWDALNIHLAMRGLVGTVFLFVVYVVYQQLQIHRFRLRVLAQEELFSLIGENAADMIAVVTVQGERLYNSPSYEKLLGYTPEDLEKTSAYEQIHPDDQPAVKVAADEAKKTGIGKRVEYRIRHKNGEWRVLESTASAVRNAQGEVEKLIIVNRDITERRQLEQQLLLSQRLEAVGKLSGGIAHDFNNILGVIIGYSEALQETIGVDDPMREAVDEIEKAGQRAAALTQQLLAFSRKQVLEPKILDLNSIVADVEKMLRRLIGADVELEIITDPTLGKVKADRGQIEQVILNLAVNARDAMEQGGTLRIETRDADLDANDTKRLRYVIPGHYVMLQVSDTGMGMTAEVQSHIFEPFYTTKEQGKGTGLGLATVYGVIKQSGGYIWLESEIGKGSTFQIYLPRAEGAATEATRIDPSFKKHGSATILVAEDEPPLLKLTCNTLRESGYKVLEAEDGARAIETAAQYEGDIQLLLTDVVMRGMNGRELADKMLSARPSIKVLYMSGYTDGAVATHGVLESGIVILRKPFTRKQLQQIVGEMLAGTAGGGLAEKNVEHTTNR